MLSMSMHPKQQSVSSRITICGTATGEALSAHPMPLAKSAPGVKLDAPLGPPGLLAGVLDVGFGVAGGDTVPFGSSSTV